MPAPPKDEIALFAKLERAEIDIQNLQSYWNKFLEGGAYPIVSDFNPKLGKYVYRVKTAAPIPVEVSLLIGDAIQHMVSALDHLAYRVVIVARGIQETEDHIYFPIGETPKEFKACLKRIKKGLRPNAIKAFKSVEANTGWHSEFLWKLKKLNNIDKHRLLLTVASLNRMHSMSPPEVAKLRKEFLGMRTVPESQDYRLFLQASKTPRLGLKSGDIVGIFAKSEMQKEMHFPIEVAFGESEILEGKLVVETLWFMFQAVQSIMQDFNTSGLLD